MKKITLVFCFSFLLLSTVLPVFAESGETSGEIKPLPWSGDWWSRQKGLLVNGWPGHQPSPFERYDNYVITRTGKNPGVLAWESNVRNTHYNPKAPNWEGHCNGWAASSLLEPEPREKKVRNGITFEVSDQKAILAELYMNTYCLFYGKRYWGKPGDDLDDIYPDQFHKLLLDQIGNGKGAMICDVSADREVWNFPLYKFESHWSSGWFNDKKLKVRTTCYFVDDGVKPDFLGTKWFSTTYSYNLFVDDDDNIVGGEWTGVSKKVHPDFVWIPTADAPNPPGTVQENPNLNVKYVHEITMGPSAAEIKDDPNTPPNLLVEAGLNPAELF